MALTPVVDDAQQYPVVDRTVVPTPESPDSPAAAGPITRLDTAGATDTLRAVPPFGPRYLDTAGPTDTVVLARRSTVTLADTSAGTDTAVVRPVTVLTDSAGATDTTVVTLEAAPVEADQDYPPAGVGVGAGVPQSLTGEVVLIAPADASVIPAARPLFTVSVDTDADGCDLQVAYATDPAFGDQVLVTTPAVGGLVDAQLTLHPETDLADTTVYYWRARLVDPLGVTAWTEPRSFAVGLADGLAYAPGTWTVQPGARPGAHLWAYNPSSGADSGHTVLVYGTGLGPDPAVAYGPVGCQVVDYTVVPAGDDAYTDARAITASGATPYHEQVTFVLPELDPDDVGAALTITAGGA